MCQVWDWLVHTTFVLVMQIPAHVSPLSSWWVTQEEVEVFPPLVRALIQEVILVQLLLVVGFGQRHVDRKNPPPRGGVCYLLCSLIKNREYRRTWYKFFKGGPLIYGS